MRPRRADDTEDWGAVLRLIQSSFAFMEGRIDPPSSMLTLTAERIAEQAREAEVWLIGPSGTPSACVFLTPMEDALYIGKLAVASTSRGRGQARQLVELAEDRARALGLSALQLQVRVELIENQATFAAMGFVQTGETAHPGYDHTTSLTFRKTVA